MILVCFGCGPSISELVRNDRLLEACQEVGLDESTPDYQLVGDAIYRRHEDVRVSAHRFEVAELESALGYVPEGLRAGRFALVAVSAEAAPDTQVSISAHTGTRAPCCELEEWLHVDGRDDEVRRLREARREAERDAERPRGPLGVLRGVGGWLAGVGRDVAYVVTLGAVDVDISELRGAQLAPSQLLRRVYEQVSASIPDGHDDVEDEHESEAQRRARAAATLNALLSDEAETTCLIMPGESTCTFIQLAEVRDDSTLDLQPQVVFGHGGTDACFWMGAEHRVPLAEVNERLSTGLSLTELAALPAR